jgi:hypothetical protein
MGRKFKITLVPFMCAGLLLPGMAACQREQAETYFKLTGRIFVFNYRVSEARYMVTIEQTRPIGDGMTVLARFQDPTGGAPLEITRTAWPKLARVVLASPTVRCIKADVPYDVSIDITDANGVVVQTITTQVTSNVDQSVLAAKPLIVGPVYEPNRDVYKQDGPDFSPDPNC